MICSIGAMIVSYWVDKLQTTAEIALSRGKKLRKRYSWRLFLMMNQRNNHKKKSQRRKCPSQIMT
jgi:hypothetical protein